MKVLVATSDVPFVEGGHRVIARALVRALQESGHESEILTTPQNRFGRQFSAYVATRFTDVEFTGNGEQVDRLISLRFPSYVLKHPHHVCWLNHRMREYYDLWPDWSGRLSWKGRIKENIRRSLIHAADKRYLTGNLHKLFVQSENIKNGLQRWGGIPSEVLYPPPPQIEYRTEGYGAYILSPSRLTPLKRVHLLIEALAKTRVGNAIIIGDGPERSRIESMIQQYSLQNRVHLAGFATDAQLAAYYSQCRAVFYAPANEDYGLVTIEAFRSRKCVITVTDSGGPTELVRNERSGFVTAPEPGEIATRIQQLSEDRALAESLGNNAYEDTRNISWPETIKRLLG